MLIVNLYKDLSSEYFRIQSQQFCDVLLKFLLQNRFVIYVYLILSRSCYFTHIRFFANISKSIAVALKIDLDFLSQRSLYNYVEDRNITVSLV